MDVLANAWVLRQLMNAIYDIGSIYDNGQDKCIEMGVNRCVGASGLQPVIIECPMEVILGLNIIKLCYPDFPLYFSKFSLYK